MFNIGFPEFMMLAIIAIIFIGPERLPGVARWMGKQAARVRRAWRDIQSDMSSDEDFRAIKEAGGELRRELKSVRKEFSSAQNSVEDVAANTSRSLMGGDGSGSDLETTAAPFDDELEILRQSRLANAKPEADEPSSPDAEEAQTEEAQVGDPEVDG
jgi:sec-independent protein translocase protein TatB